jgi:signal transduction histidine kinase
MKAFLFRIIALLLVPCLAVDPAAAAGLSARSAAFPSPLIQSGSFNRQALSALGVWMHTTAGPAFAQRRTAVALTAAGILGAGAALWARPISWNELFTAAGIGVLMMSAQSDLLQRVLARLAPSHATSRIDALLLDARDGRLTLQDIVTGLVEELRKLPAGVFVHRAPEIASLLKNASHPGLAQAIAALQQDLPADYASLLPPRGSASRGFLLPGTTPENEGQQQVLNPNAVKRRLESRVFDIAPVPSMTHETSDAIFDSVETAYIEMDHRINFLGILNQEQAAALRQLFMELARNAIDAVLENMQKNPGMRGRIRLTLRSDGDFGVIEIGDNGSGMTEETFSHMFARPYTTKKHQEWAQGKGGIAWHIRLKSFLQTLRASGLIIQTKRDGSDGIRTLWWPYGPREIRHAKRTEPGTKVSVVFPLTNTAAERASAPQPVRLNSGPSSAVPDGQAVFVHHSLDLSDPATRDFAQSFVNGNVSNGRPLRRATAVVFQRIPGGPELFLGLRYDTDASGGELMMIGVDHRDPDLFSAYRESLGRVQTRLPEISIRSARVKMTANSQGVFFEADENSSKPIEKVIIRRSPGVRQVEGGPLMQEERFVPVSTDRPTIAAVLRHSRFLHRNAGEIRVRVNGESVPYDDDTRELAPKSVVELVLESEAPASKENAPPFLSDTAESVRVRVKRTHRGSLFSELSPAVLGAGLALLAAVPWLGPIGLLGVGALGISVVWVIRGRYRAGEVLETDFPFSDMRRGERRVEHDGTVHELIETASGGILQCEFPPGFQDGDPMTVIVPGKMWEFFNTVWRQRKRGLHGRMDDSYWLPQGMAAVLRSSPERRAIVVASSVDAQDWRAQVLLSREGHRRRFSEGVDSLLKRTRRSRLTYFANSYGAGIALEDIVVRGRTRDRVAGVVLVNAAVHLYDWALTAFRWEAWFFVWKFGGVEYVRELVYRVMNTRPVLGRDSPDLVYLSTRSTRWWGWRRGYKLSDGVVDPDDARGLTVDSPNAFSMVVEGVSHRSAPVHPMIQELSVFFLNAFTGGFPLERLSVKLNGKFVGKLGEFRPQSPLYLTPEDDVHLQMKGPSIKEAAAIVRRWGTSVFQGTRVLLRWTRRAANRLRRSHPPASAPQTLRRAA